MRLWLEEAKILFVVIHFVAEFVFLCFVLLFVPYVQTIYPPL